MTIMQKPPSAAYELPEVVTVPTYDAREIVQSGGQARLILDGVVYSLRITRAGKLILTK